MTDPLEPERRAALLRVAFALASTLLVYVLAVGASLESEQKRAGDAIARYMRDRGAPAARVVRDLQYRSEIVAAAFDAGEMYNAPPALLLSMAFHESSYRSDAVGDRGEIGLLQVGEQARAVCVCDDIQTPRGQMMCGACWLSRAIDVCGNMDRGLTMYATGSCSSSSAHVARIVQSRIRLYRELASSTDSPK